MIFQKLTSDRTLPTVSYFVTAVLAMAAAVALPRLLQRKDLPPDPVSRQATMPVSYRD